MLLNILRFRAGLTIHDMTTEYVPIELEDACAALHVLTSYETIQQYMPGGSYVYAYAIYIQKAQTQHACLPLLHAYIHIYHIPQPYTIYIYIYLWAFVHANSYFHAYIHTFIHTVTCMQLCAVACYYLSRDLLPALLLSNIVPAGLAGRHA